MFEKKNINKKRPGWPIYIFLCMTSTAWDKCSVLKFVYVIDCVKKSLFFTKSCTCVECEPTPPKHAKANDGVGRAAHRRDTGYVPTAESGPDHFGCYKGWKRVTKYLVLPFSFLRWWYYNHGSLGGTDYVDDLYSLLTINSKWWGHQTDHWVM